MQNRSDGYKTFLETLSPGTLQNLNQYVSNDVRFKDPFHDVSGIKAMQNVFQKMFENIKGINFDVKTLLCNDQKCLMQWVFTGTIKGKNFILEGTTAVTFDAQGYVREHIEYWDSAHNFYAKIPIVGFVLWAARRIVFL